MFGNSLSNHKKAPRKWGFFVEKTLNIALIPLFLYHRDVVRCYTDDRYLLY